jgi:hypothetical protein
MQKRQLKNSMLISPSLQLAPPPLKLEHAPPEKKDKESVNWVDIPAQFYRNRKGVREFGA